MRVTLGPWLVRLAVAATASLTLAACPSPRAPKGPVGADFTGCLPLPGDSRAALRLGPDGRYLYWTEQVRLHGYENAWPANQIVRWPVAGGPVENLTALMDNPYRVLSDGRVVGVRKDAGVTVWSPNGAELVSLSGEIDHLEVTDDERTVVYRLGESIWRQPMRREAAHWLGYADSLLGVDGTTAYVRNADGAGDHLIAVDTTTGKRTDLPWQDDVVKILPGALVIQNGLGVGLRPPTGGPVQTVLTGDDWQIRVGPDAVKAWRRVGPRLEGALVTAAGADFLPPVLGGDSLEGFVRLPDGRVAYLVGHDLDGDDGVTTGDEVDVCLAPRTAKVVRVEPRQAPSRWRDVGAKLAGLLQERLGGGTWHFAAGDAVPGIYLEVEAKGRDHAAMWADLRAVADALGAATGDATLFVDLTYADGKRGYSEWWATTGRRVAWAGTGGATVPDLADYDAVTTTSALAYLPEFDDTSDTGDEGEPAGDGSRMASCVGTVVNTSDHRLTGLAADCVSGVDDEPIDVTPADLAPGQIGRFEGVVKAKAGESLWVSIHSGNGRDEIPSFSRDRHRRLLDLEAAANQILDRARLIYRNASADGGLVTVYLAPEPGEDFGAWSGQGQEQAAAIAEEVLRKLGAEALGGVDGDELRLRISTPKASWTYADGHLTGAD